MKISHRRGARAALLAAAAALAVTSLSACGGSDSSSSGAKQDKNAELLVWTDSARQPGFEQYQKDHPGVKMKVETYDAAALLSKIQLFNRAGKGWPDVIFSGQPNDVAALSSPTFHYAQPLDKLVASDVQEGFGTTNDGCTINGKLYCLQNDVAQTILWYNKPLLEKFGYQLPTTWDEYIALGAKVAKEHPGYVLGSAGSASIFYDFFWPSGCPIQTVTGEMQVHIDMKDKTCTRVTDMIDTMTANGSLSRSAPFDPDMIKLAKEGKVLMMPGASWYGEFLLKSETAYAMKPGEIAAAAYPSWGADEKHWSGGAGGGIYLVSNHSKNLQGAADIITWMSTDVDYQRKAPTYPAYGAAADAWIADRSKDTFYAENPGPVLKAQAALISPSQSRTVYDATTAINATLVTKVRNGDKAADGLPDLQTQLVQLAQSAGYAVQ